MMNTVTEKHRFPTVGLFGVRRVGSLVVVEFGTPEGEFIFHVRERSFVKHARAPRDDQGNPWRTLEQIDAARRELEQAAAQPAEAAQPSAAPLPAPIARERKDRDAELRRAWRDFIADPALPLETIAARVCSYPAVLRKYFARFAAEPGAPALKPNGKL